MSIDQCRKLLNVSAVPLIFGGVGYLGAFVFSLNPKSGLLNGLVQAISFLAFGLLTKSRTRTFLLSALVLSPLATSFVLRPFGHSIGLIPTFVTYYVSIYLFAQIADPSNAISELAERPRWE